VHSECKDGLFWQCVLSSLKEITPDEESDITISEYYGVCKCSDCKFDSQRAVRQFERTVFTRVVFLYRCGSRWKLCNQCKHFFFSHLCCLL